MKENLKVFIMDKETLVHIGLKTIINAHWKDTKFLTENDTRGKLQEIPDIIILGTVWSNKSTGVRQLKSLIRRFPLSTILILSALDEWVYGIPYIKVGARGYLSKDAAERDMVSAVKTVLEGKHFFCSSRLKEQLLDDFFLSYLNGKNRKAFALAREIGYKRNPERIQSKQLGKSKDNSDGIMY